LPWCLVGIEAYASSHYWSRELQALGHTVRLMPLPISSLSLRLVSVAKAKKVRWNRYFSHFCCRFCLLFSCVV
jgi:transposase